MGSRFYDNNNEKMTKVKLFGGHKPIHASFGGGKVADILLWRDRKASGRVLAGVGAIWFLFEVIGYNSITLLCHILITAMLLLFIWSTAADFLKWTPPNIPQMMLKDSTFFEAATIVHKKLTKLVSMFFYVACGNDAKLFFLVMGALWILSIVGNYISTLNLIFFGLILMGTLPVIYDQYEAEIDDLATKIYHQLKRKYKHFEAEILGRIPHGPIKDKKNF